MIKRGSIGRPSKGPRKSCRTRVPPQLRAAAEADMKQLGLTQQDYVVMLLARHLGMPEYAPPVSLVPDHDMLHVELSEVEVREGAAPAFMTRVPTPLHEAVEADRGAMTQADYVRMVLAERVGMLGSADPTLDQGVLFERGDAPRLRQTA